MVDVSITLVVSLRFVKKALKRRQIDQSGFQGSNQKVHEGSLKCQQTTSKVTLLVTNS